MSHVFAERQDRDSSRKSAEDLIKVRKLLQKITASWLKKQNPDPNAMRQFAEQCRQAGALFEAACLYEQLVAQGPEDLKSYLLWRILSGRFALPDVSPETLAPFIRIEDFFSPEFASRLKQMALEDLPKMESAKVYGEDASTQHDANRRLGVTLFDVARYREGFLPALKAALTKRGIAEVFGINNLESCMFDLQLSNYSDGEYFGQHVDDGVVGERQRVISFVYYFRQEPDCFTGGDLLLFDATSVDQKDFVPSFSRIQPLDNSIVFFPSRYLHEVTETFVASGNREDGRFTINGWVLV